MFTKHLLSISWPLFWLKCNAYGIYLGQLFVVDKQSVGRQGPSKNFNDDDGN